MKKLLIPLAVILLLGLSACGGGAETPATAIPPVPADYAGKAMPAGIDAGAGAEVYRLYCASCHGNTGLGDGPAGASLEPRPVNLVTFSPQVGDDYLFWRIHDGKPGTSMVAWGGVLTEEQVWQAVAFIRTLK